MSRDELVLPLVPSYGDGRLTEDDVRTAACGIDHGIRVVFEIDECDDFEPSAPGILARLLSGYDVSFRFGREAARIRADWRAAYDASAATYLAIEAAFLNRGA